MVMHELSILVFAPIFHSTIPGDKVHPQRDWLIEKCRRVVNLLDGTTENRISHINRLISHEQVSEKYRRIAEWKHEPHSNSKAAYQWLRAGLEPVPTNLHCGDTPAHSISECLPLLRDYCIWDRGRPDLEETIQQMTPLLGPSKAHSMGTASLVSNFCKCQVEVTINAELGVQVVACKCFWRSKNFLTWTHYSTFLTQLNQTNTLQLLITA